MTVCRSVVNARSVPNPVTTAAITTPARITYISASWVATASNGSMPARIRPVIAPGRNTIPSAAVCSTCGEIAVRSAERISRAAACRTLIPSARPASISARWSAVNSTTRVAATTPTFIELPMTMPATGTSARLDRSNMPNPKMIANEDAATTVYATSEIPNSPGTAGARRFTVTDAKTTMPTVHAHDHQIDVPGSTSSTRAKPTMPICTRDRTTATTIGRLSFRRNPLVTAMATAMKIRETSSPSQPTEPFMRPPPRTRCAVRDRRCGGPARHCGRPTAPPDPCRTPGPPGGVPDSPAPWRRPRRGRR
jgi:hypothetical protein